MTQAADILELIAGDDYEVAVDPPGTGEGYWAGAPSAVFHDHAFHLAYRLRRPVTEGRGYANVVARSEDGVHFDTLATVTSEQFGAASLERPAIVPLDDGWRLYVSCSTPDSKHWWVEAIESERLDTLAEGTRTVVLPGEPGVTAWKDVVVRRSGPDWQMWACRHPLDGGDDEADRMTSVLLTSADGLQWEERGTALEPTANSWDARGARISSVVRSGTAWEAFYDGRASAEENWFERTGLAQGETPDAFTAVAGPTPKGRTLRYLSFAESLTGTRVYWEASGVSPWARPVRSHQFSSAAARPS